MKALAGLPPFAQLWAGVSAGVWLTPPQHSDDVSAGAGLPTLLRQRKLR